MKCCPTAGQLAGRLPDLTRALPPDPVRIANPYAPPIHPWDGSRAASRYAWPTWGGRTLTLNVSRVDACLARDLADLLKGVTF
jgi:hypothetical protein